MHFIRLPAVVIGNSYRKQLFAPFLISKTFGKRPHFYLDSRRALHGFFLGVLLFRLLVYFSKVVVVSDDEGAEVLARYRFNTSKTIFWFCWNGSDEPHAWSLAQARNYPHLKICFLFADEAAKGRSSLDVPTSHFKFPILGSGSYGKAQYLISYLGEVDTKDSFGKDHKTLDDRLWKLSERFTSEEPFSLENSAVQELQEQSDKIPFRQIVWILKNRVRYQYAKLLKSNFGKDFVLVGSDWKKYGFEALPTDFNPSNRFQIYAKSRFCLDLLSKSTDEAHYPRSAEIISCSAGILQLRTFDSLSFLGDQTDLRSFRNVSELKEKIDHLARMKNSELFRLGDDLRARLSTSTQVFNARQIE